MEDPNIREPIQTILWVCVLSNYSIFVPFVGVNYSTPNDNQYICAGKYICCVKISIKQMEDSGTVFYRERYQKMCRTNHLSIKIKIPTEKESSGKDSGQ